MSFVNYVKKEINCKVVYYGPGFGGKTTNIQHIYKKTSREDSPRMISLNSENERTLFFDFLPLDIGEVRGFKTRFHLYTVPGQVFYESSRKLILRGVDGIIFVADSQVDRMEANLESLNDLQKNLQEQSLSLEKTPLVMQWNKRDLPNVAPIEELEAKLNIFNVPSFESCALNGSGVFETLKGLSQAVLLNLKGELD